MREKVIEFYLETDPRKVWEMDELTLRKVKRLHDDCGVFFWSSEPNYRDMPGRLFGLPITISKDKCFQLRFIFSDGHSHVVVPDFEIN